MKVYKQAIEKWGSKNQVIKTIEELSELSVELAKFSNGNRTGNLEYEIADVVIMIEQMKIVFPDWELAFERKIENLNKKIEEHDLIFRN